MSDEGLLLPSLADSRCSERLVANADLKREQVSDVVDVDANTERVAHWSRSPPTGTTLMIAAEAGVDKLSRDADPSLVPEGLQAENSLIP